MTFCFPTSLKRQVAHVMRQAQLGTQSLHVTTAPPLMVAARTKGNDSHSGDTDKASRHPPSPEPLGWTRLSSTNDANFISSRPPVGSLPDPGIRPTQPPLTLLAHFDFPPCISNSLRRLLQLGHAPPSARLTARPNAFLSFPKSRPRAFAEVLQSCRFLSAVVQSSPPEPNRHRFDASLPTPELERR
jgi:hypothetical protein